MEAGLILSLFGVIAIVCSGIVSVFAIRELGKELKGKSELLEKYSDMLFINDSDGYVSDRRARNEQRLNAMLFHARQPRK